MHTHDIPDFLLQMARPSLPSVTVADLEAVMQYVVRELKPATWAELLQMCGSILEAEESGGPVLLDAVEVQTCG